MDRATRAYRRAELALRAATLRDLLALWPAYDLRNIAATWPAFGHALLLLIRERGRTSAGLALAYYRAHRFAAGIGGEPPPPRATPTTEQINAGLAVVGIAEPLRALSLRRAEEDVARTTLAKLSGAVGMYVMDFGRDTLMNLIADDRRALGFARQTSGAPCAFCAALSSRGPVYKTEERASFEAHRGCACTVVPQWSRDQEWPDLARDFQALWSRSTQGTSGHDAVLAFRRAFERG